jgi:hypothetical protein
VGLPPVPNWISMCVPSMHKASPACAPSDVLLSYVVAYNCSTASTSESRGG